MTAPSLLLLGYGSTQESAAQVGYDIRVRMQKLRLELDIHTAFMDHCPPTALQVAKKLARTGVEEVVCVPLLLSDAFHAQHGVPQVISQIRAAHPGLRVQASRPIGPEAILLSIVDRRLRAALRQVHAAELDALVLAAAGSVDIRSNALIARRARQWGTHHRLPCLTGFANGTGPNAGDAVRTLRGQGRRHIAVGSWFLTDGVMFTRQAAAARAAGAVAVAGPLGSEDEIAQIALTRYVVAAMELIDLEPEIEQSAPAPVRHLSVVAG